MNIEYENVLVHTANFLCQKKFQIGDLKRIVAKHFASGKSLLQILNTLESYDMDFDNYLTHHSCNDTCCENWKSKEFFLGLINSGYFLYSQRSIGFGTFLSNFANLTNAIVEGKKWSIFDMEMEIKADQSDKFCSQMSKMDRFLGNYFQDLGIAIGFEKNHTLSLFDLPSMLSSTIGMSQTNTKSTKEAFLYSQCKMNTLTMSDFHSCYTNKWHHFIQKKKSHPCKNSTFNTWSTTYGTENKCCHFWTSILQHKLKPIMRVMRMASGRGQSHFNVSDFIQPFLEHTEDIVR